jgi:hypothetical protein
MAAMVVVVSGPAAKIWFGAPGVLIASPGSGVPPLPGIPSRSKSLRTQSPVVFESGTPGFRDAPPGANARPSNIGEKTTGP